MTEIPRRREDNEKIIPGQTLLFAEPVFRAHVDEGKQTEFKVPFGMEEWVEQISRHHLSREQITEALTEEHFSIVMALSGMSIPIRIIVSHEHQMDHMYMSAVYHQFGIKGLLLDSSIPSTCFPRDMMVDFDGRTYINPEANIKFPDNSGRKSPLGEGGRVLKKGKKVFVPDLRGYVQSRSKMTQDVKSLSYRYQLGFLPHPMSTEVNVHTGKRELHPNDHIDRVSAFIKGKDEKDYLLVDGNYVRLNQRPYGDYWKQIKEESKKMDVTTVVVDRPVESIPYALNLDQFNDGSVLMTGGDKVLEKIVGEIVGSEKVHTTSRPIIFYPIYRMGGIRCMMLHAPEKIVGGPVTSRNT